MNQDEFNNFENIAPGDLTKSDDGYYIFNPYNPQNIEINEADIKQILARYGLPQIVPNMEIYKRAFVHRSYLKYPAKKNEQLKIRIAEQPENCISLKTKSNERLEFIGDGFLEAITKTYLYTRFPKASEGFMTEKKIAIVKNEAIGRICHEMGLQRWLILSKNAEEKKIRNDYKRLGCLFESFLGALFLNMNQLNIAPDGKSWQLYDVEQAAGPGFQYVQSFLISVFEHHIDWTELIMRNDNYKNIFQEKLQKEFKLTPHYIEINHDSTGTGTGTGTTNNSGYTMGVFLCLGQSIHHMNVEDAVHISTIGTDIMDLIHYTQQSPKVFVCFGIGKNKIKKNAEQQACFNALLHFGFIQGSE
jgi:dsRNA-specific ribonuclease